MDRREDWDRYIRDQAHLAQVIAYIHLNPVKAGLVVTPESWPWSSAFPGNVGTPGNANLPIGVFSPNESRTPLTERRRVFPRRAIRQYRLAHLDSRDEEASPPRALTTRDEQEKSELKSPRCETGTRGTRLREVPVGIVKVVGHGANNASCRGKLFLLPR